MLKSDILAECSRRLGDEDPTFISTKLSPAFDYVMLELHQANALSTLRQETPFQFTSPACSIVAATNVMIIDTVAVLGKMPDRISDDWFVPEWQSPFAFIKRVSDREFKEHIVLGGSTVGSVNKPRVWRVFPTLARVQTYPAPSPDVATATCYMEWEAAPTFPLADSATITEVLMSDMPTLLAGLVRHGCGYRDETLNDRNLIEAQWQQGVGLMRQRKVEQIQTGRVKQIKYSDF